MSKKSSIPPKKTSTVDAEEVAQFETLREQWWDETGPMKPLHALNPTRLSFIRDSITAHYGLKSDSRHPLTNISIADIGCGGGIVAEPLARLGATVTGVDAGTENIKVAKAHAEQSGLDIDYRATTVEDLADTGARYDVVTALEIVEHVADIDLFIGSCAKIVKPGGLLILSTLNRTPKSFMLGIVAAEYILRWVPAGTHDWKKFIKPSELAHAVTSHKMKVKDLCGLVYSPVTREFSLSKSDLKVNYFLTASKS